MKLFSLMSSLLISVSAMANTWNLYNSSEERLCLAKRTCMEYNGQIIDLRTDVQIMVEKALKCDYSSGRCGDNRSLYTQITPEGASKIVGQSKEKSYFIPLNVDDADGLMLIGALSLGTIIFANDREVMDFVQNNKTQRTEQVASVANLFGREAIIPIVAGAYFMGAVMKNGKLKQIGLVAIPAALATQLATEIFKKSFKRVRPNNSDSPYDFFEDGASFFSGHTSAAFSLATVIAEVYKDDPVIPYLAYGVATLTAYARMHDEKHWATDVLAGAVAGHLITKIMMRSFESRNKSGGFIVTPMLGVHYGINIVWTPTHPKSELKCSKSNSVGRDLLHECMTEVFERSN